MGNIVPDRFFWALPPEDEEAEGAEQPSLEDMNPPGPRRVH